LRERQNASRISLEEHQRMAAEFLARSQEFFARSQALMEKFTQDSLAQEESISRIQERYSSHVDLPATSIPAKSARRQPGLAVPRAKEAKQKQGTKKRKADREHEGDVEYSCKSRLDLMPSSRMKTESHVMSRSVKEQEEVRPRKREFTGG
jgi:hypothetical protein